MDLNEYFKQVAGTLKLSTSSQVEYALRGAYDKGKQDALDEVAALRAKVSAKYSDRELLCMMAANVSVDPKMSPERSVEFAWEIVAEVDERLENA